MKKYYLILGLLLMVSNIFAQGKADWSYNSKAVNDSIYELQFEVNIDSEYIMYALENSSDGPQALVFKFVPAESYQLVDGIKPNIESKEKYDDAFEMNVRYYSNQVVFKQQVVLKNKGAIVEGTLEYQVCKVGQCIPGDDSFSFKLGDVSGIAPTVVESASNGPAASADTNQSWISFAILALFMGLVSVLTPCVFPMIPMIVSFFMNGSNSKAATISKGLIFGISVALVYCSMGVIVALTKNESFAKIIADNWIPNFIFFTLFIVFSLSFLGLIEITLPSSFANKADKQVDKGGYMASVFLAIVLAIVSFSCTGPFVGSLLIEASRVGGGIMKPIAGMFSFGLGLGLPFMILAAMPSLMAKLPKSGGWLNSVKVVFAFILIGFSFKFLDIVDTDLGLGIMSREVFIAIWMTLGILLALYLLGKIRFAHDTAIEHINVLRLFMAGAALSFVFYLLPGLFGAPLAGVSAFIPSHEKQTFDLTVQPPTSNQTSDMGSWTNLTAPGIAADGYCGQVKHADILTLPKGIKGYFDLKQGLACAKEQKKPVLIQFTGHKCSSCKKMEKEVFADPRVIKQINDNFVFIALYIDDLVNSKELPQSEWQTSPSLKPLKTIGQINKNYEITKFNQIAQPYFVIIDDQENILVEGIGYESSPDAFLKWTNFK